MEIREIEKRDVWACTNIVAENWGAVVADRFWDEVQHAWLHGFKWPPRYYVAEEGGVILGFAGMMESWLMHGVWDLIWINVRKEHQGRGVGKLLTERRLHEIDRLKGSAINLMTQKPEFFERFGFAEVATLDDWKLMTKQLRKVKI